MTIITLRTDKPEAEIGVYVDEQQVLYKTWEAHRQLAETVHTTMQTVLHDAHVELAGVDGFAVFKGPGSFTGLRIGIATANALANGLGAPIVGADGQHWIEQGIQRLQAGDSDVVVIPEYGADPHITQPRK